MSSCAKNQKMFGGLLPGGRADFFLLVVFGILIAFQAQGHGDLDIRIADVTRELTVVTNNPSLYLHRAELHREHKDWPAALADYDAVARLDPTAINVDFYRGRMLADANRLDEARTNFDRYISHQPNDGNGYLERARVAARLGSHAKAIQDYSAGLKLLRQPQPEYFIELAQIYREDKQDAEALTCLDDGVKRLGPIVTLQVLAMELEMKQKRYDTAIARLDTIIAQAARKESWYAQRGDIEQLAQRPVDARKSYEASLASIGQLPMRLQTLPPMMNLKARVNASIQKTLNPPPEGTSKKSE